MSVTTASARCLREAIRPTTFIEAPRLARRLGINLTLASETFQHTGSFKFRAAYNVASHVSQSKIITASSGNFGQAMAYACHLLKKSCLVIMPRTSAQVKIAAVREYGAAVDLIDTQEKSRLARLAELACEHTDAYAASPYDDPLVIEGNAGLGEELCAYQTAFDVIVAPIGGGGLTSGIISGVHRTGQGTKVIAAEPLMANDAARSLRAGHIVPNVCEPLTIADGARTLSVGQHNWDILQNGLYRIVEVPENHIKEAVRLLFSLANLKAEPTGALSLAATLTQPDLFRDRSVCCVVSGGNVDTEVYRAILAD
ncbi:MAG: pyridoxal-phosphate dependent enzyme [Acidobacteria bacterium]|nr:pyridoxal-phosphate dependent enzyme [Acidobacteriota bacterium]MBI3657272.1 pyridoxal-phosphate dependent enzyme [Acidobacteriota bacterium]